MLRVLYLVHDICEPAVRRRVMMLKAGGARVTLAGFRRSSASPADLGDVVPVDLGTTKDAGFGQRIAAVVRAAMTIQGRLGGDGVPDVIVCRNLEMLALAARLRALYAWARVPVAYECLDIHRLMLREDALGAAMRAVERYLARDVSLLMTSSPAFVRHYFRARNQVSSPVELLENKHFEPVETGGNALHRLERAPWRIGWFGALRCRRSLLTLADFVRALDGRFEVVLRGKPALTAIPDFHDIVAAEPHLRFEGPYRNPEDIEDIYREVHFSWVVDYFEAGLNSSWLLPNRLYEGCRFGAIPIAVAGTETALFLRQRGIGVQLPDLSTDQLVEMLGDMDTATVEQLRRKVLEQDRKTWTFDGEDCRKLVTLLSRLNLNPPEASMKPA